MFDLYDTPFMFRKKNKFLIYYAEKKVYYTLAEKLYSKKGN